MREISKINLNRLFVVAVVICMVTSVGMFFMTPHSKTQVKATESGISTKIWLQNAVFDTRLGEPELDTLMIDSYSKDIDGYYIVQKKGYVTEEWKSMIGRMGGEIISYIPDNAFIVRMSDEVKEKIDAEEDVQWTGIYQPAYKISPALKGKEISVKINIILFPGESNGDVISFMKHSGEGLDLVKSQWGDMITARIDPVLLGDIASINGVHWIQEYSLPHILNDGACSVLQNNFNPPWERHLHAAGLSGDGQIVCVADSGLRRTETKPWPCHEVFNGTANDQGKVLHEYVPKGVEPNCTLGDECGSEGHGTGCAATIVGNSPTLSTYNYFDGHAYKAKLIFQDGGRPDDSITPDDESCIIYTAEDFYKDSLLRAYNEGARVYSNSWGYAPGYHSGPGSTSQTIDRFVWDYPDAFIAFAAGDDGVSGTSHIKGQGDSKNVITVGGNSEDSDWRNLIFDSSRGPAFDGRIKPDVVAPWYADTASKSSDSSYWKAGGTSMSTPAVAGEAAMVREYFVKGYYPTGSPISANGFSPSAALVKAVIINSAVEIDGSYAYDSGDYPNFDQGWGCPNLDIPLWFTGETGERELAIAEQTAGLVTGDYVEYTIDIDDSALDLEMTLVWSDYFGDPAAAKMLVNDLNLLITAPDGKQYKGNNYNGRPAESVDMTISNNDDDLNNVECVYIKSANVQAGEYKIRIDAKSIGIGPQPFALVVTSGLTDGYGKLRLNKAVYGDSDNVYVKVEDTDATSVSVELTTSRGDSETITLTQTGVHSGIWKSAPIPTESNFVNTGDNKLQVEDNGTITASYSDASPSHTATVKARVDMHEPMITDVSAQDVFATKASIIWKTEENSNSTVYWGDTTELLGTPKKDFNLSINHFVSLENLEMNTTYYFDVESTDWYGRTTRDDNGGTHYSFKTIGLGTGSMVLLVDDDDGSRSTDGTGEYFEFDWMRNLEYYDWSYDYWDLKRSGVPTLTDLNTYKVIVWYVDEGYPQCDESERTLIAEYLDQTENPVWHTSPMLFLNGQDIGWDCCDNETTLNEYGKSAGASKVWYEKYLAAGYKGDDADGGGGNEGGLSMLFPHYTGEDGNDDVQIKDVGHTLNIYSYDHVDLEETAYSMPDQDPSQFWPDDVVTLTGNGGVKCWDYWSAETGDYTHEHGGDSAAVTQTDCPENGGNGRVVYYTFAFEMMSLWNPPSVDATRAGMLDEVLRWLLQIGLNETPKINLTQPDGGETVSGTYPVQWTTQGNPDKIDLYYTENHGWSYELLIGNLAGTTTSYDWNTTKHQDGIYYKIRAVATNNTFGLIAVDESEDEFTVDNNNDAMGPVVIPGSIVALPNPVEQGKNIIINATIDDRNKGNSTIIAAEAYIDGMTSADLIGTMSAIDGAFDSPIEDVTIEYDTSSESHGNHTIYVRGKDSLNNWGGFGTTQFKVVGEMPAPPTNINAKLEGSCANVNITWTLSSDDGGGKNNVKNYAVYRSTNYNSSGVDYDFLVEVLKGKAYHVDVDAGDGDSSNYFYYVQANASPTNFAKNETQVGKFVRDLPSGRQLISIPLVQSDVALTTVLQTIEGNYSCVQWYNATDTTDHWKTYSTTKPSGFNDLLIANHKMALWITMTDKDNLTVVGRVPKSTTIQLYTGWNHVSYASFIDRIVQDALSEIWTYVKQVEGYDGINPPYFLTILTSTDRMESGKGYWIYVTEDKLWTIKN